MLRLGDHFPDFDAETNHGRMESFHQWIGDESWAILFSHPSDFTPVCTTELARAAQLVPEFARRRVKLVALSCDSAESHRRWSDDIAVYGNKHANKQQTDAMHIPNGAEFPFSIIADQKRQLATKLGMIDPLNTDSAGIPLTVRAVFVIDPKKRLRLSILYPASTGRNFDELLRVIDSLQLTDAKMVATPEGWTPGSRCMVEPKVSDEKAEELFGAEGIYRLELPSGKGYLRMVEPK